MTDYAQSAAALKTRWEAANNLVRFYEDMRAALKVEVAEANSALSAHGLPPIETSDSDPVELKCIGATCTVRTEKKGPAFVATIVSEAGEKTVTFLIQVNESPLTARRVSLTPDIEKPAGPGDIAAAIVQELIAGAP